MSGRFFSHYIPEVAGGQIIALGQAVEVDVALPIRPRLVRLLGQATELDQARPIIPPPKIRMVTELDTAMAMTPRKSRVLGQAVETDLAQPFTHFKRKALGQAVETDTALPFVQPAPPLPPGLPPSKRKLRRLPLVHIAVDGREIPVVDWKAHSVFHGGDTRFVAVLRASDARRISQEGTLEARLPNGRPEFLGAIAQPPRGSGERVQIIADGEGLSLKDSYGAIFSTHGIDGWKVGTDFPLVIQGQPVGSPPTAEFSVSVEPVETPRGGRVVFSMNAPLVEPSQPVRTVGWYSGGAPIRAWIFHWKVEGENANGSPGGFTGIRVEYYTQKGLAASSRNGPFVPHSAQSGDGEGDEAAGLGADHDVVYINAIREGGFSTDDPNPPITATITAMGVTNFSRDTAELRRILQYLTGLAGLRLDQPPNLEFNSFFWPSDKSHHDMLVYLAGLLDSSFELRGNELRWFPIGQRIVAIDPHRSTHKLDAQPLYGAVRVDYKDMAGADRSVTVQAPKGSEGEGLGAVSTQKIEEPQPDDKLPTALGRLIAERVCRLRLEGNVELASYDNRPGDAILVPGVASLPVFERESSPERVRLAIRAPLDVASILARLRGVAPAAQL